MCAVQYEDVPFRISGSPVPDVKADYPWTGYTTHHAQNWDYWHSDATAFTLWNSATTEFWTLADTFPAEPAGGDHWWQADKLDPISAYYPNGTAAGIAHAFPIEAEETPWEQWGMDRNWLTRSDAEKKMHGQAFVMRTNFPPDYAVASFLEDPDPAAAIPAEDNTYCIYVVASNTAYLYIRSADNFLGDGTSGLSIFQVRPAAAEKSWERDWTRISGAFTPYETKASSYKLYTWTPTWPAQVATGIRYFARGYYRTAIVNYGPYWTIAPP